jgi:cutinase
VADHVVAIAVFGNPLDRYIGAPLTTVSPDYATKAVDLCNTGDPICTPRPGDVSVPPRDELLSPAHVALCSPGW